MIECNDIQLIKILKANIWGYKIPIKTTRISNVIIFSKLEFMGYSLLRKLYISRAFLFSGSRSIAILKYFFAFS